MLQSFTRAYSVILLFCCVVSPTIFFPISASAQSEEIEILKARLDQLEQRQATLEQENLQLREQIVRMVNTLMNNGPGAPIRQVALTTPAAPAAATAPPAAAPQAAAEAPPQKVQFGAEIRFRPEARSSFRQNNNVNNFILQRVRLDARLRLNENVTGLIQLQDSRLWGQEGSTASNEGNADLHQGYVQVANFFNPAVTLRLGRQELAYGNQRLVGSFGWDNVGRSFDAAKLTMAGAKGSLDFFAGRALDRRNSGRGDDSQDLIGLYGRLGASNAKFVLEPYLLYLRDGLEIAGEIAGTTPESTRILTLGFRHFGATPNGFSYDSENAYQVGQRGPDTQRAVAVAGVARYRSSGHLNPEIGFEYDYASGDGDPTDGRSEEFNNLFPTNHLHYGYADYMGWRNMQNFKPYFALQLRPGVRAEFSYHRLLLADEKGAWKSAGGAVLGLDRTGKLGTDLGHELDATLAFPLLEHVRILSGYSIFIPGKFARGTQGGRASQFAYWQTQVSF